jgi:signal transduction histidine kinase
VQERGGIESVVELRVTDQGEGIPEEALPHIFERFFRVDRSRSRSSGGAGLGLSICKAIVERLEGTIHIQSAMGRGTEVTVTLPARLSPS